MKLICKTFIHFVTCLVLEYLTAAVNAQFDGHYNLYQKLRSCSTVHHVTGENALLGNANIETPVECLIRCEKSIHCGSVTFTSRDSVCIYYDKDFLVCDEDLGIMTKVQSDFCSNGGTIINETLCSCTPDFTGAFCDVDIHRGDDCDGVICENGGTCQDLFNDYQCLCNYQFTGAHCETHICDTVACLNGGTCDATDQNENHYLCNCQTGYTGVTCETDVCTAVTCHNYGTCVHTASTSVMWMCDCVAGFSDTYCTTDNGPVTGISLYSSGSFTPGSWWSPSTCPTGTYFGGFNTKVDATNGAFSDDFGLTEIDFYCYRPMGWSSAMTSIADPNVFSGGEWQSTTYCPAGYFIVQFRQFTQPDMGLFGDNTGTNNIQVKCRGPGMTGVMTSYVYGSGASFNSAYWTSWSSECPSSWAVCSVQVKTDPNLGISDLTMRCCEY